jgi:type IV pilus assembly protein PilE
MEYEMNLRPNTRHLRHVRVHHQRGMSLMELMIVVAIVGILGTIALSSYRRQMLRSNRIDGTSVLLQVQVAQEKFFLQNRQYAADDATLAAVPPAGLGIPTTTNGGHYTMSLLAPTATTYPVTATATGGQTEDTACPVYTITETGARTPNNASGCWR